METGERLAAYLSGELDTDERTALEAELARDAALRRRLEAVRAADAALGDLPEVDVPEDFSARLRAAVSDELGRTLGDELAQRRARRRWQLPRWAPAVGAAAAAVVAVVVGVTAITGSGDDTASTAGGEAARDSAAVQQAPEAFAGGGMTAPASGPVVVDRSRRVTEDDLAVLAADPRFAGVVAENLDDAAARDLAQEYARTLTGAPPADTAGDSGAQMSALEEGTVSADDLAAVDACLPTLSAGAATPVIPLYAELATDADGDPVIVFAALGAGASDDWDRIEVWMLDRDTCAPLHFVQQAR